MKTHETLKINHDVNCVVDEFLLFMGLALRALASKLPLARWQCQKERRCSLVLFPFFGRDKSFPTTRINGKSIVEYYLGFHPHCQPSRSASEAPSLDGGFQSSSMTCDRYNFDNIFLFQKI